MRLQVPSVLPSVAAGGGAASLKAAQALVIGNAMANLELTRNVPLANLAKVARVAAWGMGPSVVLGLALTGLEWASDHWESMQGGQSPELFSGTCSGPYPAEFSTLGEMCENNVYQFVSYYPGLSNYPPGVVPLGWTDANSVPCSNYPALCGGATSGFGGIARRPKIVCTGGVPADVGGNCPAVAPASESELESAISSALQAQPSLAGQVLDRALEDSQARAQLAAGPLGITGPATVDGGTTTSTRVDTAGTTTIQTQRTYNLSYQGDTVNLTQTQVETVTDPANNVTTTTTTTDTPTGDPPPPDEPPDLCAENPDASGCAPFGTPEPPTPLPQEDRTVSVAPEMSAAGACPAPQAFSIAGQSFQLTYDGACEFAQGIRPVVLAVAWMGAFVFLFSIGRAQTS